MSGFSAWLIQRLSAVYMAVFILIAIIWSMSTDITPAIWQQGFASIWVKLSVLLFGLSVFTHAWVGLRDVVLDYVHPLGLRLLALSLIALFLFSNVFWFLSVLWG